MSRCDRGVRVLAALMTAGLLVAACGFPTEDSASPVGDDELPAGLVTDPTEPAGQSAESAATLWFVDGDRLVSVSHDIVDHATAPAVIEALLVGPSEAEQRRGLRSALPDPSVVDGASFDRATVDVQLASSFADIPIRDQLFAVGQIVLTATNVAGVGTVVFTVDGEPIAVPLPTGEISSDPLYRQQYVSLRDGIDS
jgi:spore germination protein GerM